MQALKDRVENGRIKLDEPTDLPDGTLLDLVPVDLVPANDDDGLTAEQREQVLAMIDESFEDEAAGRTESFSKFVAGLRAQS